MQNIFMCCHMQELQTMRSSPVLDPPCMCRDR